MSIKQLFEKLLLSVKDVEDLIKLVSVEDKRDDFECKLKKIKKKCNQIPVPKVKIFSSSSPKSLEPVIPISGQSRLNIHSTKSVFDSNGYYKNILPESWEITWETGTINNLIIEYREREDASNGAKNRVLYAEIFDVKEALFPIIGTNVQDVDGNYYPMGAYLGPTNVKQFAEKADFYGELSTTTEGRHIHISSTTVPKVTGASVIATANPNDFFSNRLYRSSDNVWNEVYEVRVLDDSIIVKVGRMFKDDSKGGENWTTWKKLQFIPDGTMSSLEAQLQRDGNYEVFGRNISEEKKIKYISLLEKLFL
jgi:hypothetical protein